MADTKISALPASTTPLAGTEEVPLVQSATTKKVSVSDLTSGRTVSVGRINATTGPGTPSSNGQFGYTATAGAVIAGTGTTYDVQLQNKTNQNVVAIPTGTRDLSLAAGNLVIDTAGKGIQDSTGATTSQAKGSLSVNNATATTLFTLPSTGQDRLMCHVTCNLRDAADSYSYVCITGDRTALRVAVNGNAASATISVSGHNVQVTQTFGSTQTIHWAYTLTRYG